MNNEKLKIAICGYLPYGGKVLIRRNLLHYTNKPYREYVKKINGTIINGVMEGGQYNYIKPLLFPISSLTKEIQLSDYNNGEPFVPIVEILKIAEKEWYEQKIGTRYAEIEYKETPSSAIAWFSFIATKSINLYIPMPWMFPMWIIDLLNQWKIDYRGLINEGLAIEVNSDNNPYL